MKRLLAVLVGVMVASGVLAGNKPIQISITPSVALFDRSETIEGLCLSIWGENHQRALALGIVNGSTGKSVGVSWAFLLNYAEDYSGIQFAPVNYAKDEFLGWQMGMLNACDGTMKGLQTGAVNYADRLTGVQFGFVNYAATAETGLQIGAVNLIPQNEWFSGLPGELAPGMIFVNWRF